MANSDELVKYIAEQVITYIETPKDVRKAAKVNMKQRQESWQTRWFGMLPLAARMIIEQVKIKK